MVCDEMHMIDLHFALSLSPLTGGVVDARGDVQRCVHLPRLSNYVITDETLYLLELTFASGLQ